MRLLGLDPGLRRTGWGAIDVDGTRLRHVANGTVAPNPDQSLAARLAELYAALENVMEIWKPQSVAVEETFVNKNPASTLKLGQARGVVLLAPARAGLEVFEYHNRTVKQAVVGSGRAAKQQVAMMVATLLPGCRPHSEDAADALAVAICHAHHLQSTRGLAGALAKGAAA